MSEKELLRVKRLFFRQGRSNIERILYDLMVAIKYDSYVIIRPLEVLFR